MTTDETNTTNPTTSDYSYHRDRDGVDDVFYIDDPEGNTILELHFWDDYESPEATIAEQKAQMIVTALNMQGGGWTHQPLNVRSKLAERQAIAAVWSIFDVWDIRPDLTQDQAWEVLRRIDDRRRARDINRATIRYYAEKMFPQGKAAKS